MVPPVLFIPAIAVTFALGQQGTGPFAVSAWLFGGYVFWTLTEYWMHRIVFHFEPERGLPARLHWIIHGVHHDHPNDPMRLVMPPRPAFRWRSASTPSSIWSPEARRPTCSPPASWPATCSTT
ncbi:MAG: hypothetical protein WKF40_00285 [Thermoleophilaceae bacterium]